MKKYILTLLLIAFIIPSVAMASWWNPFSWKIFHKASNPQIEQPIIAPVDTINTEIQTAKEEPIKTEQPTKTEKIKKEIKNEVSSEASWKAIEDYLFPIADGQGLISFRTINSEASDQRYYTKENNKWTWKINGDSNIGLFGGPSYNILSSRKDNLVCNYKSFTLCSIGKEFYCPSTGDAICKSSQSELEAKTKTEALTTELKALNAKLQAEVQRQQIANQNALIIKQQANEQAIKDGEKELKRINDEIEKMKADNLTKKTQLNQTQVPSINCSNYYSEKNEIDNRHERNGTVFSGARISELNTLELKYVDCF